jgi:hypothetical protein
MRAHLAEPLAALGEDALAARLGRLFALVCRVGHRGGCASSSLVSAEMEAVPLARSGKVPPLAGKRLLLPVVSLGGVAQLAADLVIAYGLERVAHVSSDCHVPAVGAVDTAEPSVVGLTTPLELFVGGDNLALLLQRSPPLKVCRLAT